MSWFDGDYPEVGNGKSLRALVGDAPGYPWICSFDGDPGARETPQERARWSGKPVLHDRMWRGNEARNNFFAISTFNPDADGVVRRRAEQAVATFCIGLDDVGTKLAREVTLPPTWVIETSPDNFHVGYALVPTDPRAVQPVYDALVDKGLATKDAKGCTRYLRLPVGSNQKPKHYRDGVPFQHRLTHWKPGVRYTLDQIIEHHGLQIARSAQVSRMGRSPLVHGWIVDELEKAGLIIARKSDGSYICRCWRAEEHSDPRDDSGAWFAPGGGATCHHEHARRPVNLADLMAWARERCGAAPTHLDLVIERMIGRQHV